MHSAALYKGLTDRTDLSQSLIYEQYMAGAILGLIDCPIFSVSCLHSQRAKLNVTRSCSSEEMIDAFHHQLTELVDLELRPNIVVVFPWRQQFGAEIDTKMLN